MNTNSVIHPNARIGKNVEIGPFCYISEHVEIGDGCRIGPHTVIFDYVRLGRDCRTFPGSVIGAVPQDLKFAGEESWVEIGDRTVIRECATIHRGTAASGKLLTRVGSDCLLMCYSHVAHDCRIGDHVILSGYSGLAGEVDVDDWAILGGAVVVHQFTHIGAHSMIGGGSILTKDVPPYVLAGRYPVSYEGLNLIGLRRRGFTPAQIESICTCYRLLYESGLRVEEACARIESQLPVSPERDVILTFVRSSARGIIRPTNR